MRNVPPWEKTPRSSSKDRPFWHNVPAWEKTAGTRPRLGRTSESPEPFTWANAGALLCSGRQFSPKQGRCAKQGRFRVSNTQISPKPRRCAKQDSFRVSDMRTSPKAGHCAALLLQSQVVEREEPNFDYQAKNALPKPGLKARLPSTAHQKQQRTSLREREAEKSLTAEAQKGPGSSPGPV